MSSGGFGRSEGLNQEIIQEEELDFSDLFLYNPVEGEDKDDTDILLPYDSQPPVLVVDPHAAYVSIPTQASSSQDSVSQSPTTETLSGAVFDYLGLTSRASNIPAPSPRIEITPSGDSLSSQTLQPSPGSKALGGYRECVSPASSNSSTGWQAEGFSPVASPCVSPSTGGGCGQGLSALDLCPGLQGIHTSSSHSSPVASSRNSITDETYLQPQDQRATSPLPHQRSRSASPHGKRAYNQAPSCHGATPVKQRSRSPSPVPSPHEKHPGTAPSAVVRGPPMQAQTLDSLYGDEHTWVTMQGRMRRAEYEVKPESFYMLPAVWPSAHPALQGGQSTFSGLAVAPLPSFEFTLPSQTAQYELVIQQQPKSHHRAHYETEGSRGAVKTPNGSHPEIQLLGYHGAAPLVLQVFIGTADERLLKPHAFYQVHRITGKTVTTPSIETIINGTKVLEISLEPKNHMGVVIDCVGILKLRNADIELRNGETDIGRKNTRVRLVFRVHIPQPGGQLVSLQIASHPIECSQRSAQEFPAVERQNLDRCSVLGGQQMVLTGQNFTSDSKVVFSEKTQNGQQVWEVEATVDRNKTQANMLFVEVPPYRDQRICHPTKVNFYVINGRKKHSQPQHFIYIPVVAVKAEPLDDYLLDSYRYSDIRSLTDMSMKPVYHHHERENNRQALNVSSPLYHLTTANTLTPNALDEQPVYYQSRVGTLYQPATHYYSNCSTSFTHGSPMASHPASTHELALRVKTPVAKLAEVPHVGDSCNSYSVSRHQGFVPTAVPLGKSALPRYVQGHPQGKTGSKVEQSGQDLVKISPAGGHHEEPSPERITVKQENLSYAYLEDVNDIIRRDMKSHNGD